MGLKILENEKQEIQKNEKNENSISEKINEPVDATPNDSDAPIDSVPVDIGSTAPVSDPMLEEISKQLAELMEKYDEQIEKKDQKEVATLFVTPSGPIAVTHEISLGHLILATLIFGAAVFNILDRLIRR